ncbi:MAG: hypothetical protein ACHQ51_06075 [Elusimicrobiota bacterium]
MGILLAALLAAVTGASAQVVDVDAGNEAEQVKLAIQKIPLMGLTLTPSVRVGELAPGGRFPAADSPLRTSPYVGAGVTIEKTGGYELKAVIDASRAQINSGKGFSDPDGTAASPASALPGKDAFSQTWTTLSSYVDAGRILSAGRKVSAAIFGSVDSFGTLAKGAENGPVTGMLEGSVGAAMKTGAGRGDVTVSADLRLQEARRNMFRNEERGVMPAVAATVEYGRPAAGGRAFAGVEAVSQRADVGVRPYVGASSGRVTAMVAAELRKSRDPFYPDARGVAARLSAAPTDGVVVSVEGRIQRGAYALSPEPTTNGSFEGQVSIDLGRIARLRAAHRERDASRISYRPEASREMNARLPGPDYASIFAEALRTSPTFDAFVARVPVNGTDGVLDAVSAFTQSFGARNYNYDAPKLQNLDDLEQLYERGRASYLDGARDPILICIGSAQFSSRLAQALGARAGVPIEASAVTVEVPNANGVNAGHAVAAIRTKEYGIVFADWGKLTPTHTYDTAQALRVYQAVQGVPEVYHTVTGGPDGRAVGYLFTEEGKAMIRRLTFHGSVPQSAVASLFQDAPNGGDAAAARYRALLSGPPR